MQISLVDSLSRRASVAAINGYQKHISPRKGFACAHRVLYGDVSCSQYIKQAIAQEGFRVGWLKSRDRFQACKQANQILHSRSTYLALDASEQKKRRRWCNDSSCFDCGDGCECAEGLADLTDWDCSFLDCSGVDCSGVDCSGADCSGVSCNSINWFRIYAKKPGSYDK
jgi:putative component of membrane protein insertase Oxa1/YidC/SpoIIIJ protein YidD